MKKQKFLLIFGALVFLSFAQTGIVSAALIPYAHTEEICKEGFYGMWYPETQTCRSTNHDVCDGNAGANGNCDLCLEISTCHNEIQSPDGCSWVNNTCLQPRCDEFKPQLCLTEETCEAQYNLFWNTEDPDPENYYCDFGKDKNGDPMNACENNCRFCYKTIEQGTLCGKDYLETNNGCYWNENFGCLNVYGLNMNLPTDFVSSTASSITDTMTGLWPIVIFVIAIPIAFYILRKVKNLAKMRSK